MGGGTHSYSIFHPSIPPSLRWLKETATAHKLSAPQGIVTTRRDEAMGNPDYIGSYPPLFLICINTKQEQCGVQTTHGVLQADSGWCLDTKIVQKLKHASYSPMITYSANLNQSCHCFACNLHCNFWSYQEGNVKKYDDTLERGAREHCCKQRAEYQSSCIIRANTIYSSIYLSFPCSCNAQSYPWHTQSLSLSLPLLSISLSLSSHPFWPCSGTR